MSTKFGRFLATVTGKEDAPEYERDCAHCEHAQISEKKGGCVYLCTKRKARVNANALCAQFSYDMLKRVPRKAKPIPTLDPAALDDGQ